MSVTVGSFLQSNRDRDHLVQGKESNAIPNMSIQYPQKIREISHFPHVLGLIMLLKEARANREYFLMKGWRRSAATFKEVVQLKVTFT